MSLFNYINCPLDMFACLKMTIFTKLLIGTAFEQCYTNK